MGPLRWALLLAAFLPVRALAGTDIGFELYSWQTGPRWQYAVFEGTTTVRSSDAIRSRRTRLKDLSYLKGRLAALPVREKVYWREDKTRGFLLPSKELIHEVRDFAEGLQLRVILPDEIKK